ncbi:MAG TPA: 3-phosphoshikimate 1-carboxyvinyltransferase [Flavobacterium sp.]|jgi:3-phosphoshikimate 1-carboxyvinyltransferase
MNIILHKSMLLSGSEVKISGSKSETNRLLLLQALYPGIILENISDSDDSILMVNALQSSDSVINVHHAGTAMRFLTAYFASQPDRQVTLTGSSRMKERPIKVLVDALRQLGAEIAYVDKEGFPPLKITGKRLSHNKVTLDANVSSQYVSALLLIGGKLPDGLDLTLQGEITSRPYIEMTISLLKSIGIDSKFLGNNIRVYPKPELENELVITIESDWSSASYFYSMVALSEAGTQITLSSFKQNSFQGDSELAEIYQQFGVHTMYGENIIILTKQICQLSTVNCQLIKTPDIAQTIAVTCFGLGISCHLTGLHTLKIKETDRLSALQAELQKFGAKVSITSDSITLAAAEYYNKDVVVNTYNDHRMAMAFAPLVLKTSLKILDAEVVSKSYPAFWADLRSIGVTIQGLPTA